MIEKRKSEYRKMKLKRRLSTSSMLHTIIIYLFVCLIIFINIIYLKSSIIGFITSIIYLYISSVLCGNIFFKNEISLHKTILGLSVLIVLLSFVGSIALAFYQLTSDIVIVLLLSITSVLVVLNLKQYGFKKKFGEAQIATIDESADTEKQRRTARFGFEHVLQGLYIVLAVICLVLLFMSRSEEVVLIWDVLHPAFAPSYFIATCVLLITLFSKTSKRIKLFLVVIHSILIHSLLIIVLNPGFYGDQWWELGLARDVYNWGKNVPNLSDFLVGEVPSYSLYSAFYYAFRKRVYQVLVTVFAHMFGIDVYWSHIFLTPLLWATLVPFSIYKILKILGEGEGGSIFGAFLSLVVPVFVWYGAITIPDTLGTILFCLMIYLTLRYLSSDKMDASSLLVILMVIFVSFSTHFKTGIVSFAIFLLAFIFKEYRKKYKGTRLAIQLVLPTVICIGLLPFALFALYGVYPQAGYMHVSFSAQKLLGTNILSLFFGEYVNYSFGELLVSALIPFVGIVGLTYTVVYARERRYNHFLCVFSLLALVVFLVDYRILKYAMLNVPFSSERIWLFRDLLVVPFAAIIIKKVYENLPIAFIKKTTRHPLRFSVGLLICCLLVSGLALVAAESGYTYTPSFLNPTPYEVEAIQFIHGNVSTRYVVIGDPVFVYLAHGILGFKSRGTYTREHFYNMYQLPSADILVEEMERAQSPVGFFVISARYKTDFSRIVTSALEVFDIFGIFGDKQLYVFRYPRTEREYTIPFMIDAGNYSRTDYPIEYKMNWTEMLFGIGGMHLDPNGVRVVAPGGQEVPSRLEEFQSWFENCSSTDGWSASSANVLSTDGDVLTFGMRYTSETPELGRLTYDKFEKNEGNLTIDVQKYKYLEIKWKENYVDYTNIRLDLWFRIGDGDEVITTWARPSTEWTIWRYDFSLSNGTLNGLLIDVFDAPPGNWVGNYSLYIDWMRFVSDSGTIRWLYNGTANTKDRYLVTYDFLENTESGNQDGFPEKSDLVFQRNKTIPPPLLSLLLFFPLNARTVDLLGHPLSDVRVNIKEIEMEWNLTDTDGWASLVVPPGQWTLVVSENGVVHERSLNVLGSTVVVQRLDVVWVQGISLDALQFALFIVFIMIGCVFLLLLLQKIVFSKT